MLLNFLQCIRQHVKTKNYPVKNCISKMLTNSGLGTCYLIGEYFIQILDNVFLKIY